MKWVNFGFYISCIFSICIAAPQTRIAGGDDAVLGQLPYQAALFVGGSPNCGAVILSDRFVLTGLRCVASRSSGMVWSPQLFTVSAGSVDLYGGKLIVVEKIMISPNYSEFDTGLALLKLRESFVFSDAIQSIPLATERPPIDSVVEVSGWGRLKEGDSSMFRYLQLNEANVLDPGDCSRILAKTDDQIICLGHARKNGICLGDFGGPAVYEGKLVGIAAYIVGECGTDYPDVFTSIASNYDWIVEMMTP